jgi:hypothetical protein
LYNRNRPGLKVKVLYHNGGRREACSGDDDSPPRRQLCYNIHGSGGSGSRPQIFWDLGNSHLTVSQPKWRNWQTR